MGVSAVGLFTTFAPRSGPDQVRPPGAVVLRDRGPFELRVQTCELDTLQQLGGRGVEIERWRVPAAMTWGTVVDAVDAQLGQGWTSSTVGDQNNGYQRRIWERPRWLRGPARVAVAVLDDPVVGSQDTTPFRVVIIARVSRPSRPSR